MTPTINRDWIAAEFSKGIEAEQALIAEARARADAPPDPALGVLYNEIAAADERHRTIIETVATRYGHTPSRGVAGGIGETLTRLKDKVTELGTTPLSRIGGDLAAKANAIHWYTAWVHTFEAIGDSESARELAAILTEEKAHRDALQEGLNRMVEHGATGGEAVAAK
jgi:ferritin-like metal-binding protein YciE